MRFLIAILLATFVDSAIAQKCEVTPFAAITAKAVKVEPLTDSVAVILTDRDPGVRTGAYLRIESDAKWATPLLDGVNITQTKTPGEWVLFAPAGRYRILLAEFDPEQGPRYSFHDLVIPTSAGEPKPTDPTPKPTDPKPTDPGDLAELKRVAKSVADQISDPKTKAALATGFKAVIASNPKTYAEAIAQSKTARRFALTQREGSSLQKDWSRWLTAVDAELQRSVPDGNVIVYLSALAAIIEALEDKS